MKSYQMILGILMFAFVTAVIYVWGLKRATAEQSDLNRILVSKCVKKIIKYLNTNNSITENKIAQLIDNTKAGLFWSKNKLKITNGKKFSKDLIDFMIKNNYIIKNGNKYCLKK